MKDIYSYIDNKCLMKGFNSLSLHEKRIYVITSLYYEVPTGGFYGYYSNSAGNYAMFTVSALQEIGAYAIAEILNSTIEPFFDKNEVHDRAYRSKVLAQLESQQLKPFLTFDKAFVQADVNIDQLLVTYIGKYNIEIT